MSAPGTLGAPGACTPRAASAARETLPRDVKSHWDVSQREPLLEIARRVKVEHCANYTTVALGLQAFVRNAALSKPLER